MDIFLGIIVIGIVAGLAYYSSTKGRNRKPGEDARPGPGDNAEK